MKMLQDGNKRCVYLFLIIGLCYAYAFFALGGMEYAAGTDRQNWEKTAFSINADRMECKILRDQTVVLYLSGLPQKQETVKLQYYREDGQMICERAYVLRNGSNDLGKIKENAAYIEYIGRKNVMERITDVYQGTGSVFDWKTFWYVGSGIAVLAMMQYAASVIKKKYAG